MASDKTDKTDLTSELAPSQHLEGVLSEKSVLSAEGIPPIPRPRPVSHKSHYSFSSMMENQLPPEADAERYLAFLRSNGPDTYGAAASALGWGATRAWQAEARLRAAGLVHYDGLGKALLVVPIDVTQKSRNPAVLHSRPPG